MLLLSFVSLPLVQAATFKDVPSTHSNYVDIDFLSSKGIIQGYKDSTFKPENYVTNRQAAVMLVRALNLFDESYTNPGFSDVPTTDSSYKEIAIATEKGFFPKESKFSPNANITRESMARALAVAYNLTGTSEIVFSDVPKTYWAYSHVTQLAANNITTGYNDGTFKPKNEVTRAHFAAFLTRAMDPSKRPTVVHKPATGLNFYEGLVPRNIVGKSYYYMIYADGFNSDPIDTITANGSQASGNFTVAFDSTVSKGYMGADYVTPMTMSETTTSFILDHWTAPPVIATYPITVGAETTTKKSFPIYEEYIDEEGMYIGESEEPISYNDVTAVNKVVSINGEKKEWKNLIVIEQTTKDGVSTFYFKPDVGLVYYAAPGMNYVLEGQ